MSLCLLACECLTLSVCVCVKQIETCISDGCDNQVSLLKTSARLLKFQPYPFSRCVFEERRQCGKKQNKTVVASVHLGHLLRLAFSSTWNATVYQTHLYVCLEMGRFGINPSAAQLGFVLLCVCSTALRFILRESWQHDDANVWLLKRMHRPIFSLVEMKCSVSHQYIFSGKVFNISGTQFVLVFFVVQRSLVIHALSWRLDPWMSPLGETFFIVCSTVMALNF